MKKYYWLNKDSKAFLVIPTESRDCQANSVFQYSIPVHGKQQKIFYLQYFTDYAPKSLFDEDASPAG